MTRPAQPRLISKLHSLAEAGRFVARLGDVTRMVQRQGQAGLSAIPASDLFEA